MRDFRHRRRILMQNTYSSIHVVALPCVINIRTILIARAHFILPHSIKNSTCVSFLHPSHPPPSQLVCQHEPSSLTTYRLHVIIHHSEMKILIEFHENASTPLIDLWVMAPHDYKQHSRVGGRNGSGRQMLIHFLSWRKTAKSGKLIRSKFDFKTMINGNKDDRVKWVDLCVHDSFAFPLSLFMVGKNSLI